MTPKQLEQLIPQKVTIRITEEMIENFAAVTDDHNPIHLSKEVANKAGLPDKVAHGMLSMAISSRMTSELVSHHWMVEEFQMKFISPLFVNDTLTIQQTKAKSENSKVHIHLEAYNEKQHKIARGKLSCKKI